MIHGARINEYWHEKSRIVQHPKEERNFHIFYELLNGLNENEKEKYGLQSVEKYFYLNQGDSIEIDGKDDSEDFRFIVGAMQVLGFTNEEQDIIFRILASILHLGNVYFHRKQFRYGQEGVEIGSETEIQWVSHLLHVPIDDLFQMLTMRQTETRTERILLPLTIDRALDMRDSLSKTLFMSLFGWILYRINHIIYKKGMSNRRPKIAVLDMFGYENLNENSFEQLCINYANELMFQHYIKCNFKLEQNEYLREKVEWKPIESIPDNLPVINLISKKPIGILPLLEDESNFPKANNNSFLEKCHYNHALNDIYSRARMNALEFGIKHFEGQTWYSVEGFLEKNRNVLKADVLDMLQTSKLPIMNKIFYLAKEDTDFARQNHRQGAHSANNDGRFVTMKPRASTVSARFQESIGNLFETIFQTNPWFIRCLRPNDNREPMNFNDKIIYNQIKQSALVETILIRKNGFLIRMKYAQFVARYHCFIKTSHLPRGTPSKDITRLIIEKYLPQENQTEYRLGFSKIFLKESAEMILERKRNEIIVEAVSKIQASFRGYQARKRFKEMKRGIVNIQRTYRGYRERRNFQILKRGMIRLQATYRMRKQRKAFEIAKSLKQKRELERIVREKAQNLSKSVSPMKVNGHHRPLHNQHHQEPSNDVFDSELNHLMEQLENWKCVHQYGDIIKQIKAVIPLKQPNQLPSDIDHHSFAKFVNIYFRSNQWAARIDPISGPFLQKNSEELCAKSMEIFKLILRFQNEPNLSGKREKLLADFIVQKGLTTPSLRDEILCQLCNQTWKNSDEESCDRAWILMAHCLSSFSPSPLLYKYLLKYVSDHGPNPIRSLLQRLLLTSDHQEPYNSRAYPASLLEWKAMNKHCGTSVEINLANSDVKQCQIDSWTTSEQITGEILKSIGFENNQTGWSVDFDDGTNLFSLNGDDYLFDMVAQMELCPSFPASKNYFIGCSGQNFRSNSKNFLNPFHNPDLVNKFLVDEIVNQKFENQNHSKISKRLSSSFLANKFSHNPHRLLRSMSGDVFNDRKSSNTEQLDDGFGLAKSKLNERYLKNSNSFATFSHLNEMDENFEENSDIDLKLSEKSRLNQRYINNSNSLANENNSNVDNLNKKLKNFDAPSKKTMKELRSNRKNFYHRKGVQDRKQSDRFQRSISMQELGLAANSSLNIRYFSRDKLDKTASLTGGSDENDSDSFQQPLHYSLMNFDNTNELNGKSFIDSKPLRKNHLRASSGNDGDDHRNDHRRPIPAQRKSPHIVRPDSSTAASSSSSFESDSSSGINENHNSSRSNSNLNEMHKRYKKFSPANTKYGLSKSQQCLNNRSIKDSMSSAQDFVSAKGSAMSDTSEAPSLASHIRNIGIPSHTSELDQYLDDLFNPVLDAQLDDAMSDARSLAQSIKGGYGEVEV